MWSQGYIPTVVIAIFTSLPTLIYARRLFFLGSERVINHPLCPPVGRWMLPLRQVFNSFFEFSRIPRGVGANLILLHTITILSQSHSVHDSSTSSAPQRLGPTVSARNRLKRPGLQLDSHVRDTGDLRARDRVSRGTHACAPKSPSHLASTDYRRNIRSSRRART